MNIIKFIGHMLWELLMMFVVIGVLVYALSFTFVMGWLQIPAYILMEENPSPWLWVGYIVYMAPGTLFIALCVVSYYFKWKEAQR